MQDSYYSKLALSKLSFFIKLNPPWFHSVERGPIIGGKSFRKPRNFFLLFRQPPVILLYNRDRFVFYTKQ